MNLLKFLISKLFLKNLLYAIGILIVLFFFSFIILKIYTHHGQAISVPNYTGLTLEEVVKKARKNKFRVEVIDSVFINNLPKGTVIEQNPNPGFKVKANRRIFLTLNAFNPEKVKMPNITGVSLRQADGMLKNAGLEIGKLIFVPDIAVNNVLKQKYNESEILEGELIPKGSKIDLVLGRGLSDKKTPVPNLHLLKLSTAKNLLLRSALNVGAIIYDESVIDLQDTLEAKIWRQYPAYKESELLNLGSTVDMWLSVDSIKLELSDSIQINN